MALPQFRRIKTDNDDLRQVQDSVGFIFQDLLLKQIVDGNFFTGVAVSGATSINHKLNRAPLGYIVVMKDANVSIWDNQSTNKTPKSTLALNSSGATNISLWVF